jgi:hypothetical protein
MFINSSGMSHYTQLVPNIKFIYDAYYSVWDMSNFPITDTQKISLPRICSFGCQSYLYIKYASKLVCKQNWTQDVQCVAEKPDGYHIKISQKQHFDLFFL